MPKGVDRRLTRAARQASNYAIRPARRGFHLWRFKDWSRKNRGWRVLATYQTREQAEQDLLHRLDLEPTKPEAPKLIMATISYVDTIDDYWGWQ